MVDSVIPERALAFSPSLAASIGLEEAIMLQYLQASAATIRAARELQAPMRDDSDASWTASSLALLSAQLPFWPEAAVRRILLNLVELGMLSLQEVPQSTDSKFSFRIDDATSSNQDHLTTKKRQHGENLGGTRIQANWQPDDSLLQQLHAAGVPGDFALQEVPEFVMYWLERNEISHSWSSKFLQHVTRRWQYRLQADAERVARQAASNSETANKMMHSDWHPSEDALDILLRMGISENFIEDAIPEFVLHWKESGEEKKTWNSKFVTHIKRQWAKYTHAMNNETEPTAIQEDWQPDQKVFDVLELANIDHDFARQLVPEFVMYWRDKNDLHHSWNTRFLQFVKNQWARIYGMGRHVDKQNSATVTGSRKTRDRTIIEDLSDRSWASKAEQNG